jgi:exopolysaccharide biosynthesis protein
MHPVIGALGIDKKRNIDIAWVLSDSTKKYPWASQLPVNPLIDSSEHLDIPKYLASHSFKKWKMKTAVAGGPVLVQDGIIAISNNQELKFTGKAINDKHPRTAMGYTADNKLIFLVIEGRFPGKSDGATLVEEATILRDLGSVEALNLDGGGSSCLLVNGKETIYPSDKEGERAVPAVIMIKVRSERRR